MCNREDDPSQHDEALEDTVDWARLRKIRAERIEHATPDERINGIPQRVGWAARHADGMRHSEARRGR